MASAWTFSAFAIDGERTSANIHGIDGVVNWREEESRDQSPIRRRSSHCRNSPLKPRLSATRMFR